VRVVELRAVRGRPLVAGVPLSAHGPDGRTWGLPADLVEALQEWARVAASLPAPVPAGGPGPDGEAAAISRRGRRLAARMSVELAAPVDYLDPVTGHRVALRAVTRTPHPPPVPPLRPRDTAAAAGGSAPPVEQGALTPEAVAAEPTPWGVGLVLTVLVAGVVLLANLALAAPLITGLGVLGLLVDAAVVAGLVPALWLNRRVPTWRWAVYGTFAGTGVALVFLAVAAF
jgi:hypothetical protein